MASDIKDIVKPITELLSWLGAFAMIVGIVYVWRTNHSPPEPQLYVPIEMKVEADAMYLRVFKEYCSSGGSSAGAHSSAEDAVLKTYGVPYITKGDEYEWPTKEKVEKDLENFEQKKTETN
jgi:hypothetical protein